MNSGISGCIFLVRFFFCSVPIGHKSVADKYGDIDITIQKCGDIDITTLLCGDFDIGYTFTWLYRKYWHTFLVWRKLRGVQ
jgi:hypothetical protein